MKITTVLFMAPATEAEIKEEIRKTFPKGFAYLYTDRNGHPILKSTKQESNFNTFVKRIKL